MTLEQLRIFVAVAEREHITRASEALNLTQSATSSAIAALEERHAVRLFDRIGRGIRLNSAGRDFLAEARGVLARASLAERRLGDLAGTTRGALRLAASQTVANYWLPGVMARFHAAYPGIDLSVEIGNSDETIHRILDLSAEIGVIEGEADDPALATVLIPGDRLDLIVPPALIVTKDDIGPETLRALPWVLRESGSGTRAGFEAWIARFRLKVHDLAIAFELSSNEAVLAAVEAGAGAAILSDLVARRSVESGRVRSIAADLPTRSFHLIAHADRHPTAVENAFNALARSNSKETG